MMTDPANRTEDDTVRLDLADLVDPNPTAYVERYLPPVPPARRTAWGPHEFAPMQNGRCALCGFTEGDGRAEHDGTSL